MRQPADDRRIRSAATAIVTSGVVERGDQRGRTIGFPTANIALEPDDLLDGVWASWVDLGDERHLAAVSIGSRPTFYGVDGFRLLEAHLVDFDGDLYDRSIVVTLWHKLRDQYRFDSVDNLVEQLGRDVAECRLLAARCDERIRTIQTSDVREARATPICV